MWKRKISKIATIRICKDGKKKFGKRKNFRKDIGVANNCRMPAELSSLKKFYFLSFFPRKTDSKAEYHITFCENQTSHKKKMISFLWDDNTRSLDEVLQDMPDHFQQPSRGEIQQMNFFLLVEVGITELSTGSADFLVLLWSIREENINNAGVCTANEKVGSKT